MKVLLFLRKITSIFRKAFGGDQQDREPQHERGHALMASTSKTKALSIYSGALNHMMDERDSFSYLETGKSIPIHMGDDSTIISEGQGTADLKHGYFFQCSVCTISCIKPSKCLSNDTYGSAQESLL